MSFISNYQSRQLKQLLAAPDLQLKLCLTIPCKPLGVVTFWGYICAWEGDGRGSKVGAFMSMYLSKKRETIDA